MSDNQYNFSLRVQHKTYDILDPRIKFDFDNHSNIFMNLYKNDITEQELKDLHKQIKYVRIFVRQDRPDSNTYIKCYCRNVSEMVESHKEEADEYFREALKQKYFNNENLVLIEINYVTQGFFMLYEL